ncbi:MAG: hypothetical protein K6T17_08200 [Fimbriimonadales bacterium]|nr:hypothetical protein [Fimbriimonadales bacterium]
MRFFTCGIAGMVFLPALVFGHQWNVTVLMQKSNVTWEEALGAVLLADLLDLDATFILSTQKEVRDSVFVFAPALILYRHTGVEPKVLWNKRCAGKRWGVLAHELGVHPGVFNKARVGLLSVKDEEVEGAIWLSILVKRYGADARVVSDLRSRGLGWRDVIAVIHVGHHTGRKPQEVAKAWEKRGRQWDKICREFRVPLEPPRESERKGLGGKPASQGKGKGHSEASRAKRCP